MRVIRYLKQGLTNLKTVKLRSFLAMLGIIIGSSSIMTLGNTGIMATSAALAQFKKLGTHYLALAAYETGKQQMSQKIPAELWRSLAHQIPEVTAVAPYASAWQTPLYNGQRLDGMIIGADEELAKITGVKLASGTFVSQFATFERVCVIGHQIRAQMQRYDFRNPLGRQLTLGGNLYTIIGIAEPWQENGFFTEDINKAIIIPIKGLPLISDNSEIHNALVALSNDEHIDATMTAIKAYLQPLLPNVGLFMRSAKQIVDSMQTQGHIFTLLLGIISAIAITVGGVGVMNIMLVSVAERRAEIGLYKALGARNRDILYMFLAETIMLSVTGGVIGILLGAGLSIIIASFNHWPLILSLTSALSGFLIALLTGIISGVWPASRAARLQPVACLRL